MNSGEKRRKDVDVIECMSRTTLRVYEPKCVFRCGALALSVDVLESIIADAALSHARPIITVTSVS